MAICVVVDLVSIMPAAQVEAVDGVYTCAPGAYLLLTPAEVQAMNIFRATPEDYLAVSAIFGAACTALAIIWGLRRVLRLFLTHTEA